MTVPHQSSTSQKITIARSSRQRPIIMQPKYSLESPTGGTQCPNVSAGQMEASLLHNMAASTRWSFTTHDNEAVSELVLLGPHLKYPK